MGNITHFKQFVNPHQQDWSKPWLNTHFNEEQLFFDREYHAPDF